MEGPTTIDLNDASSTPIEQPPQHVEVASDPLLLEPPVSQLSDERRRELEGEMSKLEEEIQTLKQALSRKQRQLSDLQKELGLTTWARVQNSEAVKQSKLALTQASTKTGQALKDLSQATANKWTEIKESEKMRSVTEKLWFASGVVGNKFVLGHLAVKKAITDGLTTDK